MVALPEKEPPVVRPYFDPRITLGNIATIVGGLVVAGTFLAVMNSRLDRIEDTVNGIRCTLAYAGIAPTTGACVLPIMKEK
jgi:hypothetical protein